MPNHRHALPLLLAACALLVIFATRLPLLGGLEPEMDEMNNAWLSTGSLGDVLRRVPFDWPPAGFVSLWAWTSTVGAHPLFLRLHGLLWFMLGCAFTYRAFARLRDGQTGILAMLAYAAAGIFIFLSVYIRGYVVAAAMLPFSFWMTLRYFDHSSWRRAFPLALGLVGVLYGHYTGVPAFLALGLYSVVVYPRRVLHWLRPLAIALPLALPEVLRQYQLALTRSDLMQTLNPLPLSAIPALLLDQLGSFPTQVIWLVLLVLALLMALRSPRQRHVTWALLAWAVLMPLVLFALDRYLTFFRPRHAWWLMMGITGFAAWGLTWLPRWGRFVAASALVAAMLLPVPFSAYFFDSPPMQETFRWLSRHMRWGDVILRAPGEQCATPEEWNMLTELYFPQGLIFIDDATDYRRVWFFKSNQQPDPALDVEIAEGRLPGRFFGRYDCVVQLFEQAPDVRGVAYDNGMRFHGFDIIEHENTDDDNALIVREPLARREGDPLRVRLWWSVDDAVDRDYSVGLYLVATDGSLLAQVDSAPQPYYPDGAPIETSRWQQGQLYVEERTLVFPWETAQNDFDLALVVYDAAAGVRISGDGVDATLLRYLTRIRVNSW
jgi:hypothetical protein